MNVYTSQISNVQLYYSTITVDTDFPLFYLILQEAYLDIPYLLLLLH